jgi:hypothetical protein
MRELFSVVKKAPQHAAVELVGSAKKLSAGD